MGFICKIGIIWKITAKSGGFFGFFKKPIAFLKKIEKIFQKPLALFGRILYNKTIAVGQNGAKCGEVLKKYRQNGARPTKNRPLGRFIVLEFSEIIRIYKKRSKEVASYAVG